MKHNPVSNGLVGDVGAPVQLQNVNGKTVARTRIVFIEQKNTQNGPQTYQQSFQLEAWGDAATRLAAVPVGHTIMVSGKFSNQKYQDQNGQEKWSTKLTAFAIADCGPSMFQGMQQQQQQQPFQQQTQAPYPQQQPYQQPYQQPVQQQRPGTMPGPQAQAPYPNGGPAQPAHQAQPGAAQPAPQMNYDEPIPF